MPEEEQEQPVAPAEKSSDVAPADDASVDASASAEEPEAAEDLGDDPSDEVRGGEDERGLFGRFTRKLRDRRELTDDAWKAMGAVLSTSDRAKSDFIRMMGREVRHYLDGLQLTDDLRELVTSHSLEVHASFHLKPLAKSESEEEEDEEQ